MLCGFSALFSISDHPAVLPSDGRRNGNYFVGYDRDKSQFLMIDADDPTSVAYFTEGWSDWKAEPSFMCIKVEHDHRGSIHPAWEVVERACENRRRQESDREEQPELSEGRVHGRSCRLRCSKVLIGPRPKIFSFAANNCHGAQF
jgi:hypothetical protein